ncbi:MAG TPA: LysR family transcriptional regulator [Rhodobacteraceae bacterium]|nr:LysR family transcriptional regulator [Paracoccaceae bacterium]
MQSGFLNIRHMRVFVETARTGSVSTAADLCHLSQPAATQAISSLEANFGTALLIRKRQGSTLTTCGTLVERRTRAALKHLRDGAKNALREAGNKAVRRQNFELSVTASQLRNLIAIANTGSFTVAARSLGLSQPTVHRTARNLEAVAGTPFFTARASGVRLTAAADAFMRGAKLAQSELRQAIEDVSRETGEEHGTFVLGSLPLARTAIVPKAIHAMVSTVEGFQVRVVEGRYAELLRSLREGDIDCLIGALRHPIPTDDIEQELLFQDALAIVAHPSHPLVNQRMVKLDETVEFPWIAPPKETPAGQYLFDTLQIHKRAESPVRVVSSSMAVLRGVLAEGHYVSVVSRHQINVEEALGTIAVLDVQLSGHIRDIGLTYRSDWTPTETQSLFIEYLRNFSKLVH